MTISIKNPNYPYQSSIILTYPRNPNPAPHAYPGEETSNTFVNRPRFEPIEFEQVQLTSLSREEADSSEFQKDSAGQSFC